MNEKLREELFKFITADLAAVNGPSDPYNQSLAKPGLVEAIKLHKVLCEQTHIMERMI